VKSVPTHAQRAPCKLSCFKILMQMEQDHDDAVGRFGGDQGADWSGETGAAYQHSTNASTPDFHMRIDHTRRMCLLATSTYSHLLFLVSHTCITFGWLSRDSTHLYVRVVHTRIVYESLLWDMLTRRAIGGVLYMSQVADR
jgi:hypothetical protein